MTCASKTPFRTVVVDVTDYLAVPICMSVPNEHPASPRGSVTEAWDIPSASPPRTDATRLGRPANSAAAGDRRLRWLGLW